MTENEIREMYRHYLRCVWWFLVINWDEYKEIVWMTL